MKQLFLFNLVMLLKQLREVHLPFNHYLTHASFITYMSPEVALIFLCFLAGGGKHGGRRSWWAILKTMSPSSLIIWKSRTEAYEKFLKEQNHCDYYMLKEGRSVNET